MDRNVFPVVFDGHNDVFRLGGPDGGGPGAFFERGNQGHLDLPRARDGGFGGFDGVLIDQDQEVAEAGPLPTGRRRGGLRRGRRRRVAPRPLAFRPGHGRRRKSPAR
jgi:hypothetical protein